jgi:hypothetical protein
MYWIVKHLRVTTKITTHIQLLHMTIFVELAPLTRYKVSLRLVAK